MRLLTFFQACLTAEVYLLACTSAQAASTSTVLVVTSPALTSPTPLASGLVLQIQPLGDSITWGYRSTDGNGYRLDLENTLEAGGNTVPYVGSQKSGNMVDNYNEGHPGAVISQIEDYAPLSLPWNPNIVLLMAGTNDCNNPTDVSTAPDRLKSLINEFNSAVPSAAILVALLTPIANNAAAESNVVTYNAAIPGIVDDMVQQGKHVLAVNMSSFITTADLFDQLHPNNEGYTKMATAWYAGIVEANSLGWITEAPPPSSSAGNATTTASTAIETSMKAMATKVGNGAGKESSKVALLGLGLGAGSFGVLLWA